MEKKEKEIYLNPFNPENLTLLSNLPIVTVIIK